MSACFLYPFKKLRSAADIAALSCFGIVSAGRASTHSAIGAFTSVCFNAGQTVANAHTKMERIVGAPLPFELAFRDVTLEQGHLALSLIERRCQLQWVGSDIKQAQRALHKKISQRPDFGIPLPLPASHAPTEGTYFIEGRELLSGSFAVVHIGTRGSANAPETFMAVDRLPADWRDRIK